MKRTSRIEIRQNLATTTFIVFYNNVGFPALFIFIKGGQLGDILLDIDGDFSTSIQPVFILGQGPFSETRERENIVLMCHFACLEFRKMGEWWYTGIRTIF